MVLWSLRSAKRATGAGKKTARNRSKSVFIFIFIIWSPCHNIWLVSLFFFLCVFDTMHMLAFYSIPLPPPPLLLFSFKTTLECPGLWFLLWLSAQVCTGLWICSCLNKRFFCILFFMWKLNSFAFIKKGMSLWFCENFA